MIESNEPIIKHIPCFLDYCRKKGLATRTQENYDQYLRRFTEWLKRVQKADLKPHELTAEDIWNYRLYLSRFQDKKGESLKKITQNYYLVALRALLSYFIDKDITSPLPDKVKLLGGYKREKTIRFLNLEQLEKLLQAPNTKTKSGLRDRAILETLISTGLKVHQLINLNRDQLDNIPRKALLRIKKYLETREDKNKALFINYKARRKSIGGRLTSRSIERMVKKYGQRVNLPLLVTPESLRWIRAFVFSDKEVEIQIPQTHKSFVTRSYRSKEPLLISLFGQELTENSSPTWYVVENIIKKEIIWLKNSISTMPEAYKDNPSFLKCDECILRKIAILIVSGKVKVIEFRAEKGKDLWNGLTKKTNFKKISHHGQEWHKKMMDVIYEYFKQQNYKVALEPFLNHGRADLGIYLDSDKNLYVEVGTVSLFKLWYNLSTMENTTFLIVPFEDCVIEFNT